MNKGYTILCLILFIALSSGCSFDTATEPLDDDSAMVIEEYDMSKETEQQEGGSNESETDGRQIPEASEREKELLFFDPEIFYFGKSYGEIIAEYGDLEHRGYWDGGEYFFSSDEEVFFIFSASEIKDPLNPNKDAVVTAQAIQARNIFPKMGSQIDKAVVERIVRGKLEKVYDDSSIPGIVFSHQGYTFWYDITDTQTLLPGTFITVKRGEWGGFAEDDGKDYQCP